MNNCLDDSNCCSGKKSVDVHEIRNLMGKAWGIDSAKISIDAKFNEFPSWDSLGHVNLLVALEQEYNISISYQTITELISIPRIIEFLNK